MTPIASDGDEGKPRRLEAVREAARSFGEQYRRKQSNQWGLFELLLDSWLSDPRRLVPYDEILAGLGYEPSESLPKPVIEAKARLAERLETFEHGGYRFRVENVRSEGYRLVVFRRDRVLWEGWKPHRYDLAQWRRGTLVVGGPVRPLLSGGTAASAGILLAGFVILGTVFWYGHPGASGGGQSSRAGGAFRQASPRSPPAAHGGPGRGRSRGDHRGSQREGARRGARVPRLSSR